MSYLLKDLYSPAFYDRITSALVSVLPDFDREKFLKEIFSEDFESKELKERMKHTTKIIHGFLPENFAETIEIIKKTIEELRKKGIGEDGLAFMFLPDYIETYGIDYFEESVEALEFITQFVSCEFAVRPFILKYGDQMIAKMQEWSLHESHKVRRLSSEGSRPRLPWAMGIPFLKKDPASILPILENLKHDSSEYVRRSVANSLNDIAKDHPNIVLDIAKNWSGLSVETDAIIKHGCRTLLKQGHVEILKHYGLNDEGIVLKDFKILTPEIRIGESLTFSFSIKNENSTDQKVRLEYAIYYKKQNGQNTKKVFKISERIYLAGAEINIIRKQKFVIITTRKFHLGDHQIAMIINGAEKESSSFNLLA
ncbi:3-methyladenine DNA glycosylase AlkC [Pedobacter psychrotolerans]|uniref:3-methyladenine DNA glycosylase AlkC n=1 Tax=Pedobacter psychrotolerans TaxID=1843235 RepID=A0A4R2HKY3_9SPHI|nr:DNA alkylation repair protein [Pedobacter psychrotolerans]TCO30719.1 3-methyladenine DNA glycosylase AlkC [Pedobacter psychrotolerans]GGE44934.1 DNA alkylation repair protein [Pedobacter psychrotolerans]